MQTIQCKMYYLESLKYVKQVKSFQFKILQCKIYSVKSIIGLDPKISKTNGIPIVKFKDIGNMDQWLTVTM